VTDLPVDRVEDVRGQPVGVRQDDVVVDLLLEQEGGVGALPGVDDLVVVAGDQDAVDVGFPLLVDRILQQRDVLELVDHEVVDVRDERALLDAL